MPKKHKQDDHFFFQVSKNLMQLGLDLVYGPNLITICSQTKNKKRNDFTFLQAFQDLLQIAPDIFEKTFLEDLVPNTPIQNKGKGVSRRKNTARFIQVELKAVEEKEEEISEVQISLRGRIIRNTCKM